MALIPRCWLRSFLVSLRCGANRFSQMEINRSDRALASLFGWTKCAGHRAVVRLFQRFDLAAACLPPSGCARGMVSVQPIGCHFLSQLIA